MLANNTDTEDLNKSGGKSTSFNKEKSRGSLGEQETTVKSLDTSGELLGKLNLIESIEDLKKVDGESSSEDIRNRMFDSFYAKYLQSWG